MPKKEKKTEKEKKEAKKAKQVEKVEKKALKRNKKELKDAGEDDIEKIIADFSKRENSKTAVTVEVCSQPSPRSNFTLTGLSNGEMILFGGEFSDGQGTVVFNNLYRWNLDKNEWKHIESLNTPPPRCSHQAVFYKDKLYVIGGEYATLDQFHHYKDFWALDIKTNTWTEIKATGDVPSARSGHRVCIWRGYLVLFGGFYEAMRELKWFNDIFFYSFQEERWTQVKYKPSAQVPRARSGVQMFVHSAEEVLYIYGGFSKEKLPGVTKEGRVHEDMWMMNLKTLLTTAGSSALGGKASLDTSKAVWQRVSRKGYFPSTRCGSSMTVYKNKAILFGGVFDDEGQQHSLNSMFYNEMYAFDMERKRWYQLGVKRVKVNTNGSEVKLTPAGVKEQKKVIADAARLKSDAEDDSDDSEGGEKEVNDEQLVEDTEIGDQNEDIDGEQLVDGDFFGYIDDSGAVVYLDMEEEEGVTSPKEASIPTPQAVTSVKVAELKSSATSISTTPIKAPSLSPPPLDHDMGEQKVSELVSTLFIQESPVLAVAGNIKSFIAEPVAPPPPVSISRYFQDRAEPSPRINPSLIVRYKIITVITIL